MNRQDVAYLVNSTPKYFYLLPLHFALLRRYGAACKWPAYIASEVPHDTTLEKCKKEYDVEILPLDVQDKYFLESRLAAVKALPKHIKYVLPIQEDFLLEAKPDTAALEEALTILDADSKVSSVRLMPCPGPKSSSTTYGSSSFKILNQEEEVFLFTFQATLWRREEYCLFFSALLETPEEVYKNNFEHRWFDQSRFATVDQKKKWVQVDFNLAENVFGQSKCKEVSGDKLHLAYPRAHTKANAVYLCPWPYRPTAVEKGKLGRWVYEFAEREGFPILE